MFKYQNKILIEGSLFIIQEREKIKKIYEKRNVKVSEKYIDNIMKDEARVKFFMKMYEQEKNLEYERNLRKATR